ncbi:MAG: GAF domain-containing protein, partial [Burkholderiales bacterium]|nr:GAF domain-containing protein [Burkholderiales bacterium]
MLESWQKTVDLMAEVLQVPAGLVMRVWPHEIEVLVRSGNPGNVYHPGERADLDTGLYCETVMDTRRELLVPDARLDPAWSDNPDIKLGMYSYCGLPLTWPDGRIFGTICVLDERGNEYS